MQAKLDMVVTFTSISEEGREPPDANVPQPETTACKINIRVLCGIGNNGFYKGAVSLRWILGFLSGARLEYRLYLFLSQQLSSVVQGWSTDHIYFHHNKYPEVNNTL